MHFNVYNDQEQNTSRDRPGGGGGNREGGRYDAPPTSEGTNQQQRQSGAAAAATLSCDVTHHHPVSSSGGFGSHISHSGGVYSGSHLSHSSPSGVFGGNSSLSSPSGAFSGNSPINSPLSSPGGVFGGGHQAPLHSPGFFGSQTSLHVTGGGSEGACGGGVGLSRAPAGVGFSGHHPPRKIKQFFDASDKYIFKPLARGRANTWSGGRQTGYPAPDAAATGLQDDLSENKEEISNQQMVVAGKKVSTHRNAWGSLSYADLISKAIESSADQRLTLSQIYGWMVANVQYFSDKGDSNSSAGWKNSIRHNLSLHNQFKRMPNESAGKSSWWVINEEARIVRPSPRLRAASVQLKTANRGLRHLPRSASCTGSEEQEDALISLTGNQQGTVGLSSTGSWNETMSDNYWDAPPDRMYALSSPQHQRDHRSLKDSDGSNVGVGGASWLSAILGESDSKIDDDSVWMDEDKATYSGNPSKSGVQVNAPERKLRNCQDGSSDTVMKDATSVSPGMAFIQSMRLRANLERKRHSSCMQSENGRASRSIFDDYPRDQGAPSYMDSRSAENVIQEDASETNEAPEQSAGQSSKQEDRAQPTAQAEKPTNQFQYLHQLLENSPQSAQLVADRHAFIRLLLEKPHLKAKVQQLLADKYRQRTSEIAQQAQKKLHELQHLNPPVRQAAEPDSSSHQQQMASDTSSVKSEGFGWTNPLPANSNPIQALPDVESAEGHDEKKSRIDYEYDSNSSLTDNWPTSSNGGGGACAAQSSSTASLGAADADEQSYSSFPSDMEADLLPSIDFDCDIDQVINYGNLFLNEYVDFESLKLHTSSSSEQSLCDC